MGAGKGISKRVNISSNDEKMRLDLIKLINNNLSQREIAIELGCSQSNIKYWLKKLKLSTNKKERNIYRGKDEVQMICKNHGETLFKWIAYESKYRCKECNHNHRKNDATRITKARNNNKKVLADSLGGKCSTCGYSKCLKSLDFHHKDPKEKEYGVSFILHYKKETQLKEINKCILLCKNCHHELEDKKHIINERTLKRRKKKESLIRMLGGGCSYCGYNKCLASLHFHHKDPKEKSFNISEHLNKSLTNLKIEANKCILLCANCHMEEHDKI